MFNLKDLVYQRPEDLGLNNPKSLPQGIYYCEDSKKQWLFRRWTGVVWSRGVATVIEAMKNPEEYNYAKDDGVKILGWYLHKLP
jgi:hypothetical protein